MPQTLATHRTTLWSWARLGAQRIIAPLSPPPPRSAASSLPDTVAGAAVSRAGLRSAVLAALAAASRRSRSSRSFRFLTTVARHAPGCLDACFVRWRAGTTNGHTSARSTRQPLWWLSTAHHNRLKGRVLAEQVRPVWLWPLRNRRHARQPQSTPHIGGAHVHGRTPWCLDPAGPNTCTTYRRVEPSWDLPSLCGDIHEWT